jgi:hypothetical protein
MVLGDAGTLSMDANNSLSLAPDGFDARVTPLMNKEKTKHNHLMNIAFITVSFIFLFFLNSTTNSLKNLTNKGVFR